MSRPTQDQKRHAAQEEGRTQADRELRRAVTRLLATPDFRLYLAHVVYGRCGLKRGNAWRRDSEIHREAARRDLAVELLGELAGIDPEGFIRLEQEHVHRMAQELDLATSTQERDDDP